MHVIKEIVIETKVVYKLRLYPFKTSFAAMPRHRLHYSYAMIS